MLSSGKLYGVPAVEAHLYWPTLSEQLKPAVDRSQGRYTLDSVLEAIENRKMQLWFVPAKCSCVTQITNYPNKQICTLMFCGGHDMDEWVHHLETIEDWARSEGCDAMEIYGRKGWARVLGYDTEMTLLGKNL